VGPRANFNPIKHERCEEQAEVESSTYLGGETLDAAEQTPAKIAGRVAEPVVQPVTNRLSRPA